MKKIKTLSGVYFVILTLAFSLFSCNQNNREQEAEGQDQQMEAQTEKVDQKTYAARIDAVNENANQNRSVSGNVTMEVRGDQLIINVEASGLEPDMMHIHHLHGSPEGNATSCPDAAADMNNDGFVDITEAYEVAGVTMIPFHDNPTSLEVDTETYPTADEDGNISYQQTVDLNELRKSFTENFDWEELDFSRFTYLIHGVPETAVGESVESVKGLPAHVTLPVGCASFSGE